MNMSEYRNWSDWHPRVKPYRGGSGGCNWCEQSLIAIIMLSYSPTALIARLQSNCPTMMYCGAAWEDMDVVHPVGDVELGVVCYAGGGLQPVAGRHGCSGVV